MTNIITYHGAMDALVWVKQFRNLSCDTEVIVPVAHEAILVKDGRMTDSFTMGRFNLAECAVGEGHLFESSDERVNCQIYYVKKEGTYNIKFSESQLCVTDPVLKINVELDLSGSFAIKIIDAKKFLSRLLAFTQRVSLDEVKVFFKEQMPIYVKDRLIASMAESGVSAIELPKKLMPVSKDLELKMRYIFENYGVFIEGFMLKKAQPVSGAACPDPALINESLEKNTSPKSSSVKGETMYCPACGSGLPPVSKFCFKCGKKIE